MPGEVGESAGRYWPHPPLPSDALSLGAFCRRSQKGRQGSLRAGLGWEEREQVGPRAWSAGFPLQLSLHAHPILGRLLFLGVSSPLGTPKIYLGSPSHLNKEAKPGGPGKK